MPYILTRAYFKNQTHLFKKNSTYTHHCCHSHVSLIQVLVPSLPLLTYCMPTFLIFHRSTRNGPFVLSNLAYSSCFCFIFPLLVLQGTIRAMAPTKALKISR